jgi:hypothetical protein
MLIIDSHNAKINEKKVFNLHLRNSLLFKRIFDADLVTLPEHLEDKPYKKVVFVHASKYTKSRYFIDYILNLDNPKLWYICNDYNLGEPHALWRLCSTYGFKYNVIANHQPEHSKIVNKYVNEWHVCNLNSLCFEPLKPLNFDQVLSFFDTQSDYRSDIVYFGAWRTGREKYFKKYFDKDFPVSTSRKNVKKFTDHSIHALWTNRLNWYGTKDTLFDYKSSLYIEDEKTHEWYSHLANRYYEALSYSIPTFFDKSCLNTIEKAKWHIPSYYIVEDRDELKWKLNKLQQVDLSHARKKAMQEKQETISFLIKLFE